MQVRHGDPEQAGHVPQEVGGGHGHPPAAQGRRDHSVGQERAPAGGDGAGADRDAGSPGQPRGPE